MKPTPNADIERQITDALATAPTFKGFTVQELAKQLNTPVSTTRLHVELLEARGICKSRKVGKSSLYSLMDKEEPA
ncbi:MAG: helix-turn-helix transcriptional regulator [Nitrososphaerota archaeon]|nr:helix-turn-helix transcriptional regulator [Nitrososphaerota archaeon]